MHQFVTRASLTLASVCLATATSFAQTSPPSAPPGELDAFMRQVLARRDVNRQTLRQYILDDIETFEILGPDRAAVHRRTREFTWFVRDGVHVRSPVRFEGVRIGEEDRRAYEEDWLKRERERIERRKKRAQERGDKPQDEPEESAVGGNTPIAAPRFVSEAYFMDFKFEAGTYYLAGREELEGKQVLRIEYYPERMFDGNSDGDENNRQDRPRKEQSAKEQDVSRKMNKTALVTLWVDAAEHQIVKYTFDNVWMDFLPGAWLVRVDEIHASMTMGQPFAGVWLPRELNVRAGVSLAIGSLSATYARALTNYKLAEVKTIIRSPEEVQSSGFKGSGFKASGFEVQGFRVRGSQPAESLEEIRGPAVGNEVLDRQGEVVREVRIHGNTRVADQDVLALAGLALGQPIGAEELQDIERRLKDSGRFESIEVRKRYRSLSDATDVAIVLVVHERPGVMSAAAGMVRRGPRPLGRVTDRLMFLPILTFADGYGFTYGGRFSTRGLFGVGEHLSVPLTWGGTKRAELEAQRAFTRGPLTRVTSTFGIRQRENPRFRIDDRRITLQGGAERHFGRMVRTGVELSRSWVDFGGLDDRLWTVGAHAALDSRGDPAFPRNAFLIAAGWGGLHFRDRAERVDRYTTEARGYLGLFGQSVAAARVHYASASAPLPAYERLLLGGASTLHPTAPSPRGGGPGLRGFRAGSFDGDRAITTSFEIRVPTTSVLTSARLGVIGFVDAGKAYDAGTRLSAAPWHAGVGGGVFLIAPLVKLNLDVARGLKDGDTRLHLSAGFGF